MVEGGRIRVGREKKDNEISGEEREERENEGGRKGRMREGGKGE